jgi:DNA-binding transcriptional LysR family regulator
MDRLQSMRVFQQVVDEGGFAAAARKLDMAPAVVTRLVGDLERHLGVRLLQRTTRRLALTPAGEAYLSRLRGILSEIEEADEMANAHSREMTGTVRILSLPVIAAHIVAPAVAQFQRRYPEVVLEVFVQDAADPDVEDYDLALLIDAGQIHGSAVVRTISHSKAVFCASPGYLQQHGEPRAPQELAQHRCLRLRTPGARLRALAMFDPTDGDRAVEVEVNTVMTANHVDTLLRATLDGAGICNLPANLVAASLKSGELKRVLAPWITHRLRLVAALPSRKFMPARTRAFLDFMAEFAQETVKGLGVEEAG